MSFTFSDFPRKKREAFLYLSSVDSTKRGESSPTAKADGEHIIEAGCSGKYYWRDIWRYRDLLFLLAWRDVALRYKQTALGLAWAVVRPVALVLVLTMVFSNIAKLPSDGGTPYPLLVLAGMLPWLLASAIVGDASTSLVNNAALISKVYFPRMIIPLAAVGVALVDFVIGLGLAIGVAAIGGYWPGPRALLLPPLAALAIVASLGPALLIGALNVRYRDFRHVVPFLLQLGLYVSPVGFSSALVADQWRLLYGLNPMVGIIDGFRWALLDGVRPPWPTLGLGMAVAVVLLWIGIRQFRRAESKFADVI